MSKSVSKSALKAKMLEYFREIEKSHEELIVTDNNVPVLKIIPYVKKKSVEEVFPRKKSKVIYKEDILKSTSDEWNDL